MSAGYDIVAKNRAMVVIAVVRALEGVRAF